MSGNTPSYSAFESLFREHYDALANYAYSVLRNKEDAEDVVQDVFIRVWQNNPDIINGPQIKFYLLTAIKNGCISVLRKQAGKKFVQYEEINSLPLTNTTDNNSGKKEITPAIIDEALSLLPPQCLSIFKLSRFGKLTYQQIADELGISVKTVENQVGKALKIMRDFAKQHNLSFSLLLIALMQGFYTFQPLA